MLNRIHKNLKFMPLLTLLLTTTLVSTSKADVWSATEQWSPEWEAKYSSWVKANWNIHFFENKTLPDGSKNPYYGLHIDCADTVYSMRIIFSREHGLPFVIQDPTASGRTISNKMSRWDSQAPDARIRGFLTFIYNMVSTKSLPNDTYPVAITPETVHSGGLLMTTHKNHHSWTIKEILPIGVPHLIFNSVAGAAASLTWQERQSWPNPEWVFEGDSTPQGDAGFRYWRPEAFINKPVWQVPGYNEEQYHVPLKNWVAFAQSRLASRKESDSDKVKRLMKVVCDGIEGRVSVVSEALDFVNKTGGKCMDYPTYDNYSSPNRDHRVFDDLMELRRTYQDIALNGRKGNLTPQVQAQLEKIYPVIENSAKDEIRRMEPQTVDSASICVIEPRPGQRIDAAEFKRRLFAGWVSNNPLDTFEYRWGEKPGHSSRAQACDSWDNWTPQFDDAR